MLVEFILYKRHDPRLTEEGPEDTNPIQVAVEKQPSKKTRLFVKRWISKHTEGEDEFTPLHFAAFRGNIPTIRMLLKHGADMHCSNVNGVNLLHVCA